MTKWTRLLGAMLLALMLALSVTVPHTRARAQDAGPRTIANTASANWDRDGQSFEQPSNRVELTVSPQSDAIVLYRLTSGSTSTGSLTGVSCLLGGRQVPFGFEGARAGYPVTDAPIQTTETIRAGDPLIFTISRPSANLDAGAVDTMVITLTTPGGDSEEVTLVETAANSGLFMGAIATRATPPTPARGDCQLSISPGETLSIGASTGGDQLTAEIEVLVDPFGVVFDSGTGAVINGTRLTLVNADSGQPASVFGDDGVSTFPSTITAGSTVIDSGGRTYQFPPGDYRFPMVAPGRYRLAVEPPAPYTVPSTRTPADLAGLRRPDGLAFVLADVSYGGVVTLADAAPIRFDIPADVPAGALLLAKSASQLLAEAGDIVQYRVTVTNPDATRPTGAITVTDTLPAAMRIRAGTVRLNGVKVTADISGDGSRVTLVVPPLPAGGTALITYALEVRSDARAGEALNRVQATDSFGNVGNVADAIVRVRRDTIADRITILGRVIEAACNVDPDTAPGIAGVRIMLEDGSYAVTDIDGRYHFEGVKPGTHVVQLDDSSLVGRTAVDCAQNSRSAGRAFSRFVEGRGGALKRVDFRATAPQGEAAAAAPVSALPEIATDQAAAGAERDWLAGEAPGIAWLFPTLEHNARARVVRVAIKHLPGQTVALSINGTPVSTLSSDGSRTSGDGSVAVSLWRGVPLDERRNVFKAEIRAADGTLVETLERPVFFSDAPLQAQFLKDRSKLVADGVTRPVIALRLTDRDGRPVHHGLVGPYSVLAPYYPAVEADAQQARQLAGLERAQPVWRVYGDEGIAYIELEPTTASGSLSLYLTFRDGDTKREQRVETWMDPGDRPWTVVGLAEGTVGYNTLQGRIEDLGDAQDDLMVDGRVALYAKGRILGKWLMTLSYDTDKKEEETEFGGVIDPQAYYTIYADTSERRYDAASVRRLYLKLERPQFYALFGDYDTGIDEPVLARYVRSLNGLKAEYRSETLSATAFAADAPNTHRRDEIQGNGLSGPYPLGARDILANSERVTIEVRDRVRSNVIIESRLLTRHIDYDIDYAGGILRFREPILSRTPMLDPQFIVADYEVDGIANRSINAGGRVSWRTDDQRLQVSATAIHDSDRQSRTILGGVDARYQIDPATEVRAEVAVSDGTVKGGAPGTGAGTSTAWLVEAEHHGAAFDVLAYAREQGDGFGVGQVNRSETGTRKFGAEGRVAVAKNLTFAGSAWHEQYLTSGARRIAGRGLLEYRGNDFTGRAGVTIADDRLADGRSARSTIFQLGGSKSFFKDRLEIDAQTEIPIGGKDESIDFPARHRLGARYRINSDINLIGAYEIADGENIDARTLSAGVEVKPWAGGRIALTGNMQNIAEYGPRSFAAYGLSQSLTFGQNWSADFSIDGNKAIGGIDPARVLNPEFPVASGGFVGDGSTITEDFTAFTAGATYRADLWSVTGRAEYRAGDTGDRYGITLGALRQIGEGSALGGALTYFVANAPGGVETRTGSLQMSWAHRPSNSRFSFLDKLELREDAVTGAIGGLPGPIGVPLLVIGDASSRRIINSLSVNWSPNGGGDGLYLDRSEVSLFWGTRYVADRFGADDIGGWSNVLGGDLRFDLSDMIDIGGTATVRHGVGGSSISYSAGPNVGISPFENGWISLGWNVVGFHDRDFADARYTRAGPYVTMRFKFDQLSLQGLGLGR